MEARYSGATIRRSIVQYTVGRFANALIAFLIFVWVARQLPGYEYSSYVAAFAALELALVFATFGMEWVTSIYIPQANMKLSGAAFVRFIWACVAIQLGMLGLVAAGFAASSASIADWIGLPEAADVIALYGLVLVSEGTSRVVRDQLLSSLLLQGAAQVSQLLRNAVMLGAAIWFFQEGSFRTAWHVGLAELLASLGSLAVAIVFLARYLRQRISAHAADPDWQLPPWTKMLRAGWNAWISNIANLAWGGQMVILLSGRSFGVEAIAAVGFARNLAEQVRKYLPMEFLFGIARTVVVARFARDGSKRELGVRAVMMYKANLLFLLPIVALAAANGEMLCVAIGGEVYRSAHWLFFGWLVILIFWSHHRITDLLAHVLGRSELTASTSVGMSFGLIGLVAALATREWTLVFAVLSFAEICYSLIVLYRLRNKDWHYSMHWGGLTRLAGLTFIAASASKVVAMSSVYASVAIGGVLSLIVIWTGSVFLHVWSDEEIELMPDWLRGLLRTRSAE